MRHYVGLFSLLLACSSSSVVVQDGAVTDAPGPEAPSSDAAPRPDAMPDAMRGDAFFGECVVPTDCVLLPESCCGSCGQPTRDDIDSVPHREVDAQRSMACADPIACPACEGQPDPTLLPDCSMAGCAVLDLNPPGSPPPGLSACSVDTDCVIRAAACCECGATITEQTVVALNREIRGGYESFVCAPDGIGCPECAPLYPDNLIARCVGDGPLARCTVVNTDR